MNVALRVIQIEHMADIFREGAAIMTLPVAAPFANELAVSNDRADVNRIFDNNCASGNDRYMATDRPSFTGCAASGSVEAFGSAITVFLDSDAVTSMRFRDGYLRGQRRPASHSGKLSDPTPVTTPWFLCRQAIRLARSRSI